MGAAVCCAFNHAGWQVLSVDSQQAASVSNSRSLGYVNVQCAVEDQRLEGVLEDWGPDVVVHCAASTMIEEGEHRKREYFVNNVVNHGRFLGSLLRAGPSTLIYSGTAGVYAPCNCPVSENSPRGPVTWYSYTKMLAEDMIAALAAGGLLSALIFRYFSVTGTGWGVYEKRPYDEHVITRLLKSARTGETFVLNGEDHPTRDGSPVRDFVSVKDVARAHVTAAERIVGGRLPALTTVNLGTGKGTTILELVRAVEAATGQTITVARGPRRPREPSVMLCNNAEARRLLDWVPTRELEEELRDLWAVRTKGE